MTRRHRFCASSSSLKAISRAFVGEPAPLVTRVAKVDSIALAARKCCQCSVRKAKKLSRQSWSRRNDSTALGVLATVVRDETLDLRPGVLAALGVHDLVQLAHCSCLKPLGQLVEHPRQTMHPAAPLPALGPHVAHCPPEAQGAVAYGQHRPAGRGASDRAARSTSSPLSR